VNVDHQSSCAVSMFRHRYQISNMSSEHPQTVCPPAFLSSAGTQHTARALSCEPLTSCTCRTQSSHRCAPSDVGERNHTACEDGQVLGRRRGFDPVRPDARSSFQQWRGEPSQSAGRSVACRLGGTMPERLESRLSAFRDRCCRPVKG
jgi:hypothetical protein